LKQDSSKSAYNKEKENKIIGLPNKDTEAAKTDNVSFCLRY